MQITSELIKFIESQGWTMECESPLELRHEDGSFASQQAAQHLLTNLSTEFKSQQENEHQFSSNEVIFDYLDIMSELNYLKSQIDLFISNTSVVNNWEDDSYINCQAKIQWEEVYRLVFNKNMNQRISFLLKELNSELQYYDPDTNYQEDVLAFSNALEEKMNLLNNIFQPKQGYIVKRKNS